MDERSQGDPLRTTGSLHDELRAVERRDRYHATFCGKLPDLVARQMLSLFSGQDAPRLRNHHPPVAEFQVGSRDLSSALQLRTNRLLVRLELQLLDARFESLPLLQPNALK